MIYKSGADLELAISKIKDEIYIAGAGNIGRILGTFFNMHEIPWGGYLDKININKMVCGKPVYGYEHINGKNAYVVISSTAYPKEILKQLNDVGIMDEQVLMPLQDDTRVAMDLLDNMYHIYDQSIKLKKFQDIHKGKRCFIIGNGPSLTIEDLEKLKNEITFASNSIYALYKKTSWRPTYHALQDATAIKALAIDDFRREILECKNIFLNMISRIYINPDVIGNGKIFFLRMINPDVKQKRALFSDDISQQVFTSGSVTHILLQLATYMGVKEIYLLGMDFSYSVECYANGEIKTNNVIDYNKDIGILNNKLSLDKKKVSEYGCVAYPDHQMWGYEAAKKYADNHGIKIYNATRGGRLELFDRVCFDQLVM